jgi:5-(carboxyamino)imidazole ribonucleotide synthase
VATAVAEALDYRGVLCVEMFVATDGRLLVNEIAPRPHNSGHYTIDACVTSQFEQQARVLAALPLGDTRQHVPAVMVNLLGDVWFESAGTASPREPDWALVLRHPQAKLHLYGKTDARRGRKMGHITCLGATLDDALATARTVKHELGIPEADLL